MQLENTGKRIYAAKITIDGELIFVSMTNARPLTFAAWAI